MDALANAYKGTGFTFDLQGIVHTINDDWVNIAYGSDAEYNMKHSLRQGDYKDLNMYYTTIAPDPEVGELLGYAYIFAHFFCVV